MNGVEQLEALNPVPELRGNPGPWIENTETLSRRRLAPVLALAAATLLIIALGSLALRPDGATELDTGVAAQPGDRQPSPTVDPVADQEGAALVAPGEVFARIVIPIIGVDEYIAEGVDTAQLREGGGGKTPRGQGIAEPVPVYAARPRPCWLLPRPYPLDDEAGAPVYGAPLQLLSGPERIETGWWDDRPVSRDYYLARHDNGKRYWVFYDQRRSRWFLHGVYG